MDGSKDARGFHPLWIVLPVLVTVAVALVGVMIVAFVLEFTRPAEMPEFSPSQAMPQLQGGHRPLVRPMPAAR
ncbi:MAG: hypothetical protein M0037_16105 [Betaproteobacteria bacterium]|nr:hypothetical protein [Betaproteobacteria bacterium]